MPGRGQKLAQRASRATTGRRIGQNRPQVHIEIVENTPLSPQADVPIIPPTPPYSEFVAERAEPVLDDYQGYMEEVSQFAQSQIPQQPSRTLIQNLATSGAWAVLLPKLVYPLMKQVWIRRNPAEQPHGEPACSCAQQKAYVNIVSFTTIVPIAINYCSCTHPAIALIRKGAFTSTPVNPPKWAFDLQFLAFVREQFLAGVPNFSAWSSGMALFLKKDGCAKVPSAAALARPLLSSLQHYQIVEDRISALLDGIIAGISPTTTSVSLDGRSNVVGQEETAGTSAHGPPQRGSLPPFPSPPHARAPKLSETLQTSQTSEPTARKLLSDEVQALASSAELPTASLEGSFHRPVGNMPSQHLQNLCPLCFSPDFENLKKALKGLPNAAKRRFAVLVCLDGNFEQRRLRHAGSGDQPVPSPFTYFLSQDEVDEARKQTEKVMGKKRKAFADDEAEDRDTTLPGLGMPEHIYQGCEKRFFAADEDNKKGETSVFSDTGLMAMVCRHDRVLFMANLRDSGEKRYYALALLTRLFCELPESWTAGVLYDIGCQIHRTITKHNLVPRFSSRMGWGVSVFHAFGHESACQAIYHPQKCVGFGCTDGEGCERCWSMLQKLTGVLRVSGFWRRLYILDQHISYMNKNNMLALGGWLRRKLAAVVAKRNEAETKTEASGYGHRALSYEWADQRLNSIRRAPSASKTAAAQTASGIIAMMDSLQQTDGLIKATTNASASNPRSQELLSLSMSLEGLVELRQKLEKRIRKATQQLVGRDASTAAAVQKAMRDEFLMKRMKAHAIRLKIKHQVRDVLLMSVSFKRRTSREKKDAKIKQQTDNSIARKTPGIKALARRYNAMRQDLWSHPKKQYYPNVSIPAPLDIPSLFNPDANTSMWIDVALDDDNEPSVPAYLADPKVQEGILGWLSLQRCNEEWPRLLNEAQSMLSWISGQIEGTQKSLDRCKDPPLAFQLKLRLESLTSLGTRWIHDVGEWIPLVNWHQVIPRPEKKHKGADYDNDDEEAASQNPLHEVIEELELDDQHAEFLEAAKAADAQEEDEVDKMLGKVAEFCEELEVEVVGSEEDMVGLFTNSGL